MPLTTYIMFRKFAWHILRDDLNLLTSSFDCLFWPLIFDDLSSDACVSKDCCLSNRRFFFLWSGFVSTIISSSSYVGSQFKPSPWMIIKKLIHENYKNMKVIRILWDGLWHRNKKLPAEQKEEAVFLLVMITDWRLPWVLWTSLLLARISCLQDEHTKETGWILWIQATTYLNN